jgi:hypothetical protein
MREIVSLKIGHLIYCHVIGLKDKNYQLVKKFGIKDQNCAVKNRQKLQFDHNRGLKLHLYE